MRRFNIATQDTAEAYVMSFSGSINESAQFPPLPDGLNKKLVIDLGGVDYMNSNGVQKWITWTMTWPASIKKSGLVFDRVPHLFLKIMISVKEMLPPYAVIESINAMFVCVKCDEIVTRLIKRGEASSGNLLGGALTKFKEKCPVCKEPMEIEYTPFITGFSGIQS